MTKLRRQLLVSDQREAGCPTREGLISGHNKKLYYSVD